MGKRFLIPDPGGIKLLPGKITFPQPIIGINEFRIGRYTAAEKINSLRILLAIITDPADIIQRIDIPRF